MANDRNDDWNREGSRAPARGYGSNRDQAYANARDYPGMDDRDARENRNFRGGGTGYGDGGDYRPDDRGGREARDAGRDYYGGSSAQDRDHRGGDGDRGNSFSSGQRWSGSSDHGRGGNRDYGRTPQGYDYQDRGFIARAGDEVRSWFGDEDAERRRDFDQRQDQRSGGGTHASDDHYHSWRKSQIDALDRDYHEYRQENAKKFEDDFGNWRSARQTQRASLSQVKEHMDVVGSDGGHVGTVDKVRGDRIILTKSDSDAGGRHHSIPSRWLQTVDDKVTISKTADEAHKHWRDEEQSGGMFGSETGSQDKDNGSDGGGMLNRSFSGTY